MIFDTRPALLDAGLGTVSFETTVAAFVRGEDAVAGPSKA
jgi:hypothetical protein